MSDALQVAKWLRNLAIAQTSNGISEPSGHVAWTGADALEAQAKEIAELEAMRKRDMDCVKRASIRISELERRAALKGEK
jgi:hypothetical protein